MKWLVEVAGGPAVVEECPTDFLVSLTCGSAYCSAARRTCCKSFAVADANVVADCGGGGREDDLHVHGACQSSRRSFECLSECSTASGKELRSDVRRTSSCPCARCPSLRTAPAIRHSFASLVSGSQNRCCFCW